MSSSGSPQPCCRWPSSGQGSPCCATTGSPTPPPATRPPATSFAEDLSDPVLKTIGVLEVLGATGVLLPWALDISPVLTPLAAAGLAAIMVGAIVVHVRRGERQPVVINAVLLMLALVVAVGRGGQLLG